MSCFELIHFGCTHRGKPSLTTTIKIKRKRKIVQLKVCAVTEVSIYYKRFNIAQYLLLQNIHTLNNV